MMKNKCAPCLLRGILVNAITVFMGQAVCEKCLRMMAAELKKKGDEQRGKPHK